MRIAVPMRGNVPGAQLVIVIQMQFGTSLALA